MPAEPDVNYETLRKQGTGSHEFDEDKTILSYPFGRYIIKVALTRDGKFLGVEEISVNQDFLNHVQRLAALSSVGYHDVEQYYSSSATEAE